jgi:hypothetical protein
MWKRNPHIEDETLDRLGNELLRAFEATEAEISNAATSPFLYRRIRVRIEAEERRRAEDRSSWLALLSIARQAIPAFVLIAMLVVSLHWMAPERRGDDGAAESQTASSVVAPGVANDDLDASLIGWNSNDIPRGEERK